MGLRRHAFHTLLAVTVLLLGTAYATSISNPGAVAFTSNIDSTITFVTSLKGVTTNKTTTGQTGSELLVGVINSAGNMFFDESDIDFERGRDGSNWEATLEATDDGTGTYCPPSGQATITFPARIKITRIAGTFIAPDVCYIVLNNGNPITFTTMTSGSLSGTAFGNPSPTFVAQVTANSASGVFCSSAEMIAIDGYYDPTNGDVNIELHGAQMSPTILGSGC